MSHHRGRSGGPHDQLPFEAGLLTFHHMPQLGDQVPAREICSILAELIKAVQELTENDLRIIEAVLNHPSVAAAARALAPAKPSYRSYLQRRIKAFRALLRRLLEGGPLAGLVRGLAWLETPPSRPSR